MKTPLLLRLIIALALIADGALAGEDLLPRAPTGVVEIQGTFEGARFWMRLKQPNADYGGHRMLELVYTPPSPSALGGAHLPDCPFLLLDERLRLVAYHGRNSLSRVTADAAGYAITREIEGVTIDGGGGPAPMGETRRADGPRGWDERLAPLLLVLADRQPAQAQPRGEVPTYDLFGPSPTQTLASWSGDAARIAGRPYTLVRQHGRIARIDDASGRTLLTVAFEPGLEGATP
jgi:hypothetical protein